MADDEGTQAVSDEPGTDGDQGVSDEALQRAGTAIDEARAAADHVHMPFESADVPGSDQPKQPDGPLDESADPDSDSSS